MNTLTELSGVVNTWVQEIVSDIISPAAWGLIVENWNGPKIILWDLFSFTSTSWEFYAIIFLWLLVIVWVIKDSNYRSHSTGFVIFSLLLVTLGTPLIGLPIYLAIRPLGYKYERAYWKAIMTENNEDDETNVPEFIVTDFEKEDGTDTDEDHIAQLKKQATVAKKRTTTIEKKTASIRQSTPIAKKPSSRKK